MAGNTRWSTTMCSADRFPRATTVSELRYRWRHLVARDVVSSDIDPHAHRVDDRRDEFAEIGDGMTTKSQEADGVTGQLAPSGATFAVGALLSTSAILSLVVGVFALAAEKLVVSGAGYQYTFQMTGWGWVNLLTGLVLASVALAVLLNPARARVGAIIATCLAIVVGFLWLPYYPPGSIVLIAIDVVTVWGLATWNTCRESA